MRPATFEPEQIIEAGRALQAEGRNITGFALRNRIGAVIRRVFVRYGTSTRHHNTRLSHFLSRSSLQK